MDRCQHRPCDAPLPRERHVAIVNEEMFEFCSMTCKLAFLEGKWPRGELRLSTIDEQC